MRKRGQLFGQPFVLIFALVVGALILFWGIYQVFQLKDIADDAELARFMTSFKRTVDEYYWKDLDSSKRFMLTLPSGVTSLCFTNKENSLSKPKPADFFQKHKGFDFIMKESKDQVFFILDKEIKPYAVNDTKPKDYNPLCIPTGEYIVLTSKGSYVEVSSS